MNSKKGPEGLEPKKQVFGDKEKAELKALRSLQWRPGEEDLPLETRKRFQELSSMEETEKSEKSAGLSAEEEKEWLRLTKKSLSTKPPEWTPEDAQKLEKLYRRRSKQKRS